MTEKPFQAAGGCSGCVASLMSTAAGTGPLCASALGYGAPAAAAGLRLGHEETQGVTSRADQLSPAARPRRHMEKKTTETG